MDQNTQGPVAHSDEIVKEYHSCDSKNGCHHTVTRHVTKDVASPAPKPKSKKGFASMDPEARRLLAPKGGLSAHAQGEAHEFTTDEARIAGRKGGMTTAARRKFSV